MSTGTVLGHITFSPFVDRGYFVGPHGVALMLDDGGTMFILEILVKGKSH
jgi:hypothetical protein